MSYQEEARKRAERDIRNAMVCDEVAKHLPNLPTWCTLKHLSVHGYRADAAVRYEVETRAQALEVFRHFAPLPLARVKMGSLCFVPQSTLTEKEVANADIITEIYPCVWRLDTCATPYRAALKWYAQVGAHIVQVECNITRDGARLEENHERGSRGRIIRKRWSEAWDTFPNGVVDRFGSGSYDRPGDRVVYFWIEPGAGPALEDYLKVKG